MLPKTRTVRVSVPHPHSEGAARTQISYFRGTGHSKKINFEKFFFNFLTVESENIALLNHIFFRTLEKSMLLRINLQVRLETLIK